MKEGNQGAYATVPPLITLGLWVIAARFPCQQARRSQGDMPRKGTE